MNNLPDHIRDELARRLRKFARNRDSRFTRYLDGLAIATSKAWRTKLRGFDELLERQSIRVIQFEYGRVNIDSHFLLKDFYKLLTGCGFALGKIYPQEISFKDYEYTDEDFLRPNYLGVLRSETALIERLAR